jgi:hypothetical protein
MDENFDRIVNCPLCRGSLKCFCCRSTPPNGMGGSNFFKSYHDQAGQGEHSNYQEEKCPLCDDTGTAQARVTDSIKTCTVCGGTGSVETTVKLDIGSRRERSRCSACGGSGKIAHQLIEIKTFAPAPESCYFSFDKGPRYSVSQKANSVAIDLEGAAKTFFAKWQPASQSTYLRERRDKERKQAEERARQEALKQQEVKQRLINEGRCLTCGKALGFMDKMSSRQIHKECS